MFRIAILFLASTLPGCKAARAPTVDGRHRDDTRDVIEQFIRYRLQPARIAPPSVDRRSTAQATGLSGTAELVLAEDASWNHWPGPGPRLFNNRTAHLFHLTVETPPEARVRWLPEASQLELNVTGNTLAPAPNQEPLLDELVFWAFQQERAVLEGDLVERTRAAGDFRRAYMPIEGLGGLSGLVAFPLVTTETNAPFLDGMDPSELHVVSMRLTLAIEVDDVRRDLVWLLD